MDLPTIKSYEEQAIDIVVSIVNKALEQLGQRLNLYELIETRHAFKETTKVSLAKLGPPLAITSENWLRDAIEKKWRLTLDLMYTLRYLGTSRNESSFFFYYEVIFSQPTEEYPIPQATVSVFFRVEDKNVDPPQIRRAPTMTFRLEGQHTDHDVRHVTLTADWILSIIMMKIKFFRRIEEIKMF